MKSYKLSFVEIIIHKTNLAEIIVNESIIMDLAHLAELHDFLQNNLIAPFSILINKKNDYSYDFQAQCAIGDISGLSKTAVFVTRSSGLMSTQTIMHINRNKDWNWNVKIFNDREAALAWLLCSKKEVS